MRNDQTYTRQTGEVAVTASMTVCDLADEPTTPAPLCFRTRRPSPERWARLPGRCFDVGVGVLSEKREPVTFLVSSRKVSRVVTTVPTHNFYLLHAYEVVVIP